MSPPRVVPWTAAPNRTARSLPSGVSMRSTGPLRSAGPRGLTPRMTPLGVLRLKKDRGTAILPAPDERRPGLAPSAQDQKRAEQTRISRWSRNPSPRLF